MTEIPEGLTPANQNPWYVLMTLYGEQEPGVSAKELRERWEQARKSWHSWACQNSALAEAEAAARKTGLPINEMNGGPRSHNAGRAAMLKRHQQEMERRNPPGFVYPGLPDHNAGYDLKNLYFENPLRLEQFAFFNLADFHGCTFASGIAAQKALFAGPSSFNRSSFLKVGGFQNANFDGNASFLTCDFQDLAAFHRTRFNADAEFNEAEFIKGADFESATFAGFTHFQEAKFLASDENGRQKLDFIDCNFEKPANFLRANFVSKYPNLVGTLLHERSLFSAAPEFWPVVPKQDLSQARASCGTIRHILAKQGQAEEEHFFYRREMGFAAQIGSSLQRLPYMLFGALSDYGYSIARPVWCLLALWAFGMAAFWGYFLQADLARALGTASALSFSNLFPIFGFRLYFDKGFMDSLPLVLRLFSSVQAVLSLPLLFFLGLGLRTRFRLR